jgi:hypothetical protein
LERRRHERRLRRRAVRLLLDAADAERRRLERGGEGAGGRLVERDDVSDDPTVVSEVLAAGDATPVDGDQSRLERRRRVRHEFDVPVVGGDERDAFTLTLHDQAHRRTLHPPGRQAAVDPAPEHG